MWRRISYRLGQLSTSTRNQNQSTIIKGLNCCCYYDPYSISSNPVLSINHISRSFSQNSLNPKVQDDETSNVEKKLSKTFKQPPPASHESSQERKGSSSNINVSQLDNKPFIIYRGALSDQLKRLKLFSMSTSTMGLFMQPVLISKVSEVGYGALIVALTSVGFFTYGTPLLIHYMAKRYVTDITYDPSTDKYTAATYSFFLRRKELEFSVDDIIIPDIPGPLTTFLIKSNSKPGKTIPIFTMDTCFIYLEHYGRFMKFDKPIDLHLGNPENDKPS